MNEEEIKNKLTEEQYHVLREKGTEKPFSGSLLYEKSDGVYKCKVCSNELFKSDAKFDSGTGWPSFDSAIEGSVDFINDDSYGMQRTEVLCSKCKSHLGHLFDDGITETGKRYCMNSVCLDLEKK